MDIVIPQKDSSSGWQFVPSGQYDQKYPECQPDSSGLQATFLSELYLFGCTEYTGRVTVPVLWVSAYDQCVPKAKSLTVALLCM